MKTKRKILYALLAALLLFLVIWGVCELGRSDYYNYQGYIVDLSRDSDGNTVLVTLCGNTESTFTQRWYSQVKYAEGKKELAVGDRVKLTTTRYSNTNIKKLSVANGYSAEGKLVYVNEVEDAAFLLSQDPRTKASYLYNLVLTEPETTLGEMRLGDTVKIYRTTPDTVVVDAVALLSQGSSASFTDEDLALIESHGYTLKK